MRAATVILGAGLIAGGLYLWHPAAALVFTGAILIAVAGNTPKAPKPTDHTPPVPPPPPNEVIKK